MTRSIVHWPRPSAPVLPDDSRRIGPAATGYRAPTARRPYRSAGQLPRNKGKYQTWWAIDCNEIAPDGRFLDHQTPDYLILGYWVRRKFSFVLVWWTNNRMSVYKLTPLTHQADGSTKTSRRGPINGLSSNWWLRMNARVPFGRV